MSNNIHLMNIIYLQDDHSGEFQIAVCKAMEDFVSIFPNLTIKLQNWSWDDNEMEGQLLWTLSRKLTRYEEAELVSQWEDEHHQISFFTNRKLF